VAERLGGVLEVLLQLLVVEDRLRGRLAVGQSRGGVTRGLVGLPEVLAQILVLDHPLHVGGVLDCHGGRASLGRLVLRCHGHLLLGVVVASIPSSAASNTSATRSTHTNSRSPQSTSGNSSRSTSLRFGAITRLTPRPCSASDFSFRPPIGSTCPVRV